MWPRAAGGKVQPNIKWAQQIFNNMLLDDTVRSAAEVQRRSDKELT